MPTALSDKARDLLLARAQRELSARRLVVDYYRIRQKVAYPIPLRDTGQVQLNARAITGGYPWETWLSWQHEERVAALGWAREWTGDAACEKAVIAELRAVAAWRRYGHERLNGLPMAHFARTMYRATRDWAWLDADTLEQIREGCNALLACYEAFMDEEAIAWSRRDSGEQPHPHYGNISFIGVIGLSLAARLSGHERRGWLEQHAARFTRAILDQQAAGVTEAVAYDGYMLDFMADWLPEAEETSRTNLLQHPSLLEMVRQSWTLAAPGEGMNVARFGDVEPVEMPFHASALVRLRLLLKEPAIEAYLTTCDPARLRCDALAGLVQSPPDGAARLPADSQTRAALLLRSGHSPEDLAVAMSCHSSQMGHLHNDNGTLVIGTAGAWLIDDPGYQQYLATSERKFTTEVGAHNCPTFNGMPPTGREGRILQAPLHLTDTLAYMAMDSTRCYPPAACAERVERHVWRFGDEAILVADRLASAQPAAIRYAWHGHPEAAWFAEDGLALVAMGAGLLWIRNLQQPLNLSMVSRQSGSRGHLTLNTEHCIQGEQILWWGFGKRELLECAVVEDGRLLLQGHDLSPA